MANIPSIRTIRAIVITILVIPLFIWALVSGNLFRYSTSSDANATDLAAACGTNGKKISDASTYKSGTAPYRTALEQQSTLTTDKTYKRVSVLEDKVVGPALLPTDDPKQVQLVACLDRINETPTGQTCQYDDGVTLTVYKPTYQLTVYEAKTHTLLKTMQINSFPTDECRSFIGYNAQTKRLYYGPSQAELIVALKPLVQ
jgi:hypothetical protein